MVGIFWEKYLRHNYRREKKVGKMYFYVNGRSLCVYIFLLLLLVRLLRSLSFLFFTIFTLLFYFPFHLFFFFFIIILFLLLLLLFEYMFNSLSHFKCIHTFFSVCFRNGHTTTFGLSLYIWDILFGFWLEYTRVHQLKLNWREPVWTNVNPSKSAKK